MSSRLSHVEAHVRISFLLKAENHFIVWTDHIAFIHPSAGGHLSHSTFWLLQIMLLSTQAYKHLLETLLSLLLGIHRELELLDHMVILFTILRNCHSVLLHGTSKCRDRTTYEAGHCRLITVLTPERCFWGIDLLHSWEEPDLLAVQNESRTRHSTWSCFWPCLSINFCKVTYWCLICRVSVRVKDDVAQGTEVST